MNKKLKCVLLVDDNEPDNFIHKRAIEKSGIAEHIEVALDGKDALDFLTRIVNNETSADQYAAPELIFLDINMPGINGWEFLEEYHTLKDLQKGKVVIFMLTSSLSPADLAKAEKQLGQGCFLYKPLTVEIIGRIMKDHFPGHL